MRKLLQKGSAAVLLFALTTGLFAGNQTEAANKNRKAGKAYASAVKSGKIKVHKGDRFGFVDVNGDGVKDLTAVSESTYTLYVWTYIGGKVKKVTILGEGDITNGELVNQLYYIKKTNRLWLPLGNMDGEGEGGVLDIYQIKKDRLIEKGYYNIVKLGKKYRVEIYKNNKTKKISKKTFQQKLRSVKKKDSLHIKTYAKSALIKKLKRL